MGKGAAESEKAPALGAAGAGSMDAKAQVLGQCQILLAQGLYASAATMLSFLLSPNAQDPSVYMAYGDALYNMGEYKRAEGALRNALELLGAPPEAPEAVQLRWKIAECHAHDNNYSLQLYNLTGIPASARTPQVNMALGRLYQRFGSHHDAVSCYREALSASPLAIEAVEPLAQLGEKEQDILNLVGKNAGNQRWLLSLVAARVQQAVSDHKAAASSYSHLAEAFPDNSEVCVHARARARALSKHAHKQVLCNMAVCQAHVGNLQASVQVFYLLYYIIYCVLYYVLLSTLLSICQAVHYFTIVLLVKSFTKLQASVQAFAQVRAICFSTYFTVYFTTYFVDICVCVYIYIYIYIYLYMYIYIYVYMPGVFASPRTRRALSRSHGRVRRGAEAEWRKHAAQQAHLRALGL